MAFSSVAFLFYFWPLALVLYFASSFSRTTQNVMLVLLGLVFYAWGEPKYWLLLIATILLNYVLGLLFDLFRAKGPIRTTIYLLGLTLNLGLLLGFKYVPFLSKTLNSMTSGAVPVVTWLFPIGISFFIFSAISYLSDVYRHTTPAEKNLLNLSLYFTYFPKILQGPIMRYSEFAPQIKQRQITADKLADGGSRFIIGLAKKVLIANQMGIVTDRIFELQQMDSLSMGLAWLGMIAYTLQIYYDFSGYSDMAIGMSKFFGFDLMENFNYPYVSKSIAEFWRRWHISLGDWFKHYLYFPLGGSRMKNQDLVLRNLAIVWLATGLWHGANWTFLVWGIWNFLFIALERIIDYENRKVTRGVRHVYTMLVVMFGWVIFRSDTLTGAGHYLQTLLNPFQGHLIDSYMWLFLREYGIFFLLGIVFCMPVAKKVTTWLSEGITIRQRISRKGAVSDHRLVERVYFSKLFTVLYPVVMVTLFALSVLYVLKGTYTNFIYFQF